MVNNEIDITKDGITHINIYSNGNTDLGRMLSNFTRFAFCVNSKKFLSVEAYWHWLSLPEECEYRDSLCMTYGYDAKMLGRILRCKNVNIKDDNFENKILKVILEKSKKNKDLFFKYDANLPFEHYYIKNGTAIDMKQKYLWLIEGIENIRKYILNKEV